MATIAIRNLDDDVKTRLRVRAVRHGVSMEEEARSILSAALAVDPETRSGSFVARAIRERVPPYGDIDLELPARGPMREPQDFAA
jgi:plasmid stability protein